MQSRVMAKEFTRVFGLLGRRKPGYLAALLACAVVEPTYQVVFAFASRGLLNSIEFGDAELLFRSLWLVAGVLVFHFMLQPFTAFHYEGRLHYPIIDLKLRLLRHIVRLPLAYLHGQHTGDLMTRVSHDVDELSELYLNHNYDLVSTVLWGVGSMVSMYIIDPAMAALMIILGLLTAWGNTAFSGRLAQQTRLEREAISRCNERLSDIAAGLRVIKAYNHEMSFSGRYAAAGGDWADAALGRAVTTAIRAGLGFSLSNLSFLGGLTAASYMVAAGRLDFGSAMAVIILQGGVTAMFTMTGEYYAQAQASLVGARRIFALLDEKAEEDGEPGEAAGELRLGEMPPAIVFEDVSFSYPGGEPVLEGLNLRAAGGVTTALLGASGGGKSTIVKLLLGLYRPVGGRITIGGRDISSMTLAQLRGLTAYVPQDVFLFSESIADNIRVGRPGASDAEVIGAARRARAHDFITRLPEGYSTQVGEGGHGLSGGQRQRIALARGILTDAPIWLLDEATSALDSEVEAELLGELRLITRGRTVLTVAHRASAVSWADAVEVIGGDRVP